MRGGWMRMLGVVVGVVAALSAAPVSVFGADGPADVVTEMVVKMKALRSSAVVVDYVHWPTAFNAMSEGERSRRRFGSPEAMRDYYAQILGDPEQFTRNEIAKKLKEVPFEQRALVEGSLESMIGKVKAYAEAARERYREIEFQVGKETIVGDNARVGLITTLGGKSTQSSVDLIKRDGRWLLPSVDFAAQREPGV